GEDVGQPAGRVRRRQLKFAIALVIVERVDRGVVPGERRRWHREQERQRNNGGCERLSKETCSLPHWTSPRLNKEEPTPDWGSGLMPGGARSEQSRTEGRILAR